MKHNSILSKILSIITTVSLFTTVFCMFASAAEQTEPKALFRVSNDNGISYYWADENGNAVDFAQKSAAAYNRTHPKASVLDSTYDARDYGLVTPVKDQGNSGSCWVFSAISALESNVIKRNLGTLGNVDYSEAHLVWFAQNPYTTNTSDPTYGDGDNLGSSSYTTGGHYLEASTALARGSGLVNDEDFPFYPYSLSNMGYYNESERYQSVMHLDSCYRLDTNDSNYYCTYSNSDIKQAILDYGSVQGCYYSDSSNYYKGNGYTAVYDNTHDNDSNHAVTFVGWDDNFSRTKFKPGKQPSSDGAWIVKNSWGYSSTLTDGYQYISYEDVSLGNFAAYAVQPADSYENVYQYAGDYYDMTFVGGSNISVANVFTAEKEENLIEIGFFSETPAINYTINLYTDIPASYTNPTAGTLHKDIITGFAQYDGYHTVELPTPYKLDEGEIFAVEICMTAAVSGVVYIPFEGADGTCNPKQSYYKWNTTWFDCSLNISGYALNNCYIQAMTGSAHEHNWTVSSVTSPTCTEGGYTTYSCTCGQTKTDNATLPLGHLLGTAVSNLNGTHTSYCTRTNCTYSENKSCSFGEWTQTSAPSCSNKGSEKKTCSVCGYAVTREIAELEHSYGNWLTAVEPTCETKGSEYSICSVCNDVASRETDALGHAMGAFTSNNNGTHNSVCTRINCSHIETYDCNFGEWKEKSAPTCINTGSEQRTCSDCGYTETRVIQATGHSLGEFSADNNDTHTAYCTNTGCSYKETYNCSFGEWRETLAPTCLEKGAEQKNCSVCSNIKTRETSALGHLLGTANSNNNGTHTKSCTRTNCTYSEIEDCSFGEWAQTLAPTCTAKGSEQRICSSCNYTETKAINELGHNLGVYTAKNNGTHTQYCTNTNCTYSVTQDCSFDEWSQTMAPTCTKEGTEQRVCAACGYTETRPIELVSHSYNEWTVVTSPNCTNKGSEQRTCSVCSKTEARELDALGHAPGTAVNNNNGTHTIYCTRTNCDYSQSYNCSFDEWTVKSAPTCTLKGSEQRTCSDCGYTETKAIDELGHQLGAYTSNNNGTHTQFCTNTNCTYKEINNCNLGEWSETTASTCTVKGKEQRICSYCGYTQTRDIELLNHSYGNWTVYTAATCTENGSERRLCSVCGNFEEKAINALGHDLGEFISSQNGTHKKSCSRNGCTYSETENCEFGEWNETLAPTCTAKGSEQRICSVCSYIQTRPVEIINHSYGEWNETLAPTCTDNGSEQRICAVCKKPETREVAALGHAQGNAISNTDGTHTTYCTRAKCTHSENENCNFGEWAQTLAPTCTAKGSEQRSCTQCAYIEARELNKTAHTLGSSAVTKAPTCTQYGEKTLYCSVCSSIIGTQSINPTGHTRGTATVKTPATCAKPGVSVVACTVCGTELERIDIPANTAAHSFGAWYTATAETCTQNGTEQRSCSVCGKTESRSVAAIEHYDSNGDMLCDYCGKNLKVEEAEPTFFEKIAAFFRKIADWFKNLFG